MKKRLIWVPQYPCQLRYPEWWFIEIPRKLSHVYEVITLGMWWYKESSNDAKIKKDEWTPIEESLRFEQGQIEEYLDLELREDDTLLIADLSFQESFCSQLYFKRPKKCYAYCHGTSLNKFDLFEDDRESKFLCESGHAKLFDNVFVGSEYHKDKLKWDNTSVIGLPRNSLLLKVTRERIWDIVSVARPCVQKIDSQIENEIFCYYNIKRNEDVNDWFEYSELLSSSKILLISSQEDTFNYSLLDSLTCGCIPIAPRKLCFPEILPDYLLYDDAQEAIKIIRNILNDKVQIKDIKLLNENLVFGFYSNLILQMGGFNE